MRPYRLTLTLKSGELHEIHLAARSRAYVEDLGIAAMELYSAISATIELDSAPKRSGFMLCRPYWLN